MSDTGYGAPAPNSGEVLLRLLRNPPASRSSAPSPSPPQQQQSFPEDPAIAALGPTIQTFPPPHAAFASNGRNFPYSTWNHASTASFAQHHYFQQNPDLNPNLNPDVAGRHDQFGRPSPQVNVHPSGDQLGDGSWKFGSMGDASRTGATREADQNLVFGSFTRNPTEKVDGDALNQNFRGKNIGNASIEGSSREVDRRSNNYFQSNGRPANSSFTRGDRAVVQPPPGFYGNARNANNRENDYWRRSSVQRMDGHNSDFRTSDLQFRRRVDRVPTVSVAEKLSDVVENGEALRDGGLDDGLDALDDKLSKVLELEDESGLGEKKKNHHDKDFRFDKRGHWIMNQRMRHFKSQLHCRSDINRLNAPFIELYQSLIPTEEEKAKQRQLLAALEKLVTQEWPGARLHLYGSCANSFGFRKSDIDVCLELDLSNTDKAEVLLKLAEILQSGNLQDVQALTRARVPIVKLMDTVTGIACDICINNVLAVVNTKLLRDYAQIDDRLLQLAFIVKNWAKCREVNATYRGTLSSYAYVLMCIHFLQQRKPPILPCLQELGSTYSTTVENVECSYFDQVEKVQNFGSRNQETVGELVWGFFSYWAYCHDYASNVISVRTGTTLSKQEKDWTRRVGNDRHLICIEDPFEVSHDLGRVVDKHSVRVLREEFERAARIMQQDPNPCFTLFEPYVSN